MHGYCDTCSCACGASCPVAHEDTCVRVIGNFLKKEEKDPSQLHMCYNACNYIWITSHAIAHGMHMQKKIKESTKGTSEKYKYQLG